MPRRCHRVAAWAAWVTWTTNPPRTSAGWVGRAAAMQPAFLRSGLRAGLFVLLGTLHQRLAQSLYLLGALALCLLGDRDRFLTQRGFLALDVLGRGGDGEAFTPSVRCLMVESNCGIAHSFGVKRRYGRRAASEAGGDAGVSLPGGLTFCVACQVCPGGGSLPCRFGAQRNGTVSRATIAAVSGRTPRHQAKASAACSTSMPTPSATCPAPACCARRRNGVRPLP